MNKIVKNLGLVGLLGLSALGCTSQNNVNLETVNEFPKDIPSMETLMLARSHYELLGTQDGMFVFRVSFDKNGYQATELRTLNPNDLDWYEFRILSDSIYNSENK
jgi:hypothetical protein